MNSRTLIASVASAAMAFAPVASTWAAVTLVDPVPAPNPGKVVLAGMQAACDAAAAAHGTNVDGADKWTGVVKLGDVTLTSGPTETGTHTQANAIGPVVGAGTYTPAHLEIKGDPFRNGGSVNMFGLQQSVGGHYSLAQYDFIGTFETKYDHAFSCDIYKATYHPPMDHPAVDIYHPAIGMYVVYGDFGDSEDAIRGNCAAFSAQQPSNPYTPPLDPSWWGDPFHGGNVDPSSNGFKPHCQFVGTPGSVEHHNAYTDPAFYDAPAFQVNEPQTAINVSQSNQLKAHEDADPAGYDETKTRIIGKVVVCISPSNTGTKLPGAWKKQNGYLGDKCTTAWYSGTAPYTPSNYAGTNVPNLNPDSNNWVTVPVI